MGLLLFSMFTGEKESEDTSMMWGYGFSWGGMFLMNGRSDLVDRLASGTDLGTHSLARQEDGIFDANSYQHSFNRPIGARDT